MAPVKAPSAARALRSKGVVSARATEGARTGRGEGERWGRRTAGCHGFASGAARRKWLEFWYWLVSGVVAVG